MAHTDFTHAFTPGYSVDRVNENLQIQVVAAGDLLVRKGGAVFAVDPGVSTSPLLLAEGLAGGSHPVELCRVRWTDRSTGQSGEVYAAARVRLSPAPVVDWVDLGTLGVDTGTAAFGTRELIDDASALESLTPEPEHDFVRHPGGGAVAFESGLGDGGYGCFAGRAADGSTAQVAIDFFILIAPRMESVELGAPGSIPPGPVAHPLLQRFGLSLHRSQGARHEHGAESLLVLDARNATGEEVCGFQLKALGARGEELFVPYECSGNVWDFGAPEEPVAKLILTFQSGNTPL
jgi:hypothetical protein